MSIDIKIEKHVYARINPATGEEIKNPRHPRRHRETEQTSEEKERAVREEDKK